MRHTKISLRSLFYLIPHSLEIVIHIIICNKGLLPHKHIARISDTRERIITHYTPIFNECDCLI